MIIYNEQIGKPKGTETNGHEQSALIIQQQPNCQRADAVQRPQKTSQPGGDTPNPAGLELYAHL